MKLNKKETDLLNDLKASEELCVEKYERYSKQAKDKDLKGLFDAIGAEESQHLDTINCILSGKMPDMSSGGSPDDKNIKVPKKVCYDKGCSSADNQHDAYLCTDALSTEKHVSSSYNTDIFEFTNKQIRDALNHIQKEEQEHGKQIYDYMDANGMY